VRSTRTFKANVAAIMLRSLALPGCEWRAGGAGGPGIPEQSAAQAVLSLGFLDHATGIPDRN
jgi:hypothetical protein